MEKGLKKCPFCGTEPITAINYTYCGGSELKLQFSVACPQCKASRSVVREVEGKSFGKYVNTMADVIKLWNTRAQ